jgi:hypothetical protein
VYFSDGETDWWCSEITLLDREALKRGEEDEVELRLWAGSNTAPIQPGATFRISERHRLIAEGEVLIAPTSWASPERSVGSTTIR